MKMASSNTQSAQHKMTVTMSNVGINLLLDKADTAIESYKHVSQTMTNSSYGKLLITEIRIMKY